MNWDRLEGEWKQRRGKAVHHWGKLMNDELAAIAGKHEQLVGMLQEKYGIAKDEAMKHLADYKKIMERLKQSNAELMKLKNATSAKNKKSTVPVPQKRAKKRRSA